MFFFLSSLNTVYSEQTRITTLLAQHVDFCLGLTQDVDVMAGVIE